MTWTRMPLFVWSIDVYAWILVIVLPALSAGLFGGSAGPEAGETSDPSGDLDGGAGSQAVNGGLGLGLQGRVATGGGRVADRVDATDPDAAGVGSQQADDLGDQGCLARPVVPEQTHDFAGTDLEGHVVVGHHGAEAAREALDVQHTFLIHWFSQILTVCKYQQYVDTVSTSMGHRHMLASWSVCLNPSRAGTGSARPGRH